MAKLPYSPVPEVTLRQTSIPGRRIDTPEAAFGGASAAANVKLGQTFEKVGDELFNRAVALQELDNQAEARNADAEYMVEAGKLHADYNSLKGKSAPDAYPQYQKDLKEVRQKIREKLTSPASQKLYDSSSLSTMGRTIFNGAGHAATENKRYLVGSAQSRMKANADAALANPSDEESFKDELTKTEQDSRQLSELQGFDPDQAEQARVEAVSDLWIKRVHGLARKEPFRAKAMLKEALAKGDIRGEKQEAIIQFVKTQTQSVGARGTATTVTSGKDLHWGSQIVSPAAAKVAIGTFESGNSYTKVGPKTEKHGRGLGKYQVMEGYLDDYLRRAGLPSMTPQEFLKSPDVQEKVFERAFAADMAKYGSFNEAASRWFTGMSVANAQADFIKRGTTDATPGRKGTNINQYLAATNSILARNIPLSQKTERGEKLAAELDPEDPELPAITRDKIIADEYKVKRIAADEKFDARQLIFNGINGGGRDGKIPTSRDELFDLMPGSAEAWSKIDPSVQRQLDNIMKSNAVGDVRWTQEGNARWETIYGLYKSRDPEFMNIDAAGETKIPLSARRQISKFQIDMKANPAGDPRVAKAEALIRRNYAPQLDALRLYGTGVNKTEYAKYIGALSIALDNYLEQNKKPATDQIILKEIAPQVLQSTKSSWSWLSGETPYFSKLTTNVPKDFTNAIIGRAQQTGAEPPSAAAIQRMYMRYQWKVLNETKGQKSE